MASSADAETAKRERFSFWRYYWPSVLVYSALLILALLAITLPWSNDYVGKDNDDVMRLVQVRDFLAGQGWFDLVQKRLGLDGGTLMHWSRLVDLPIAALIMSFKLFLAPESAEAAALAVWPLVLVIPLVAGIGLAGRRVGSAQTMHITMGFTVLMVLTSNRFLPGSIDHHNVQLGLVAIILAMLVDPRRRALSFAVAGFASALAIAIGAETTPLIVMVCLVVAVMWAWHGVAFGRPAMAFSVAIAVSISVLFFATVPASRYSQVTCDSLSLGYYGLVSIGGLVLLLSVLFTSRFGRLVRFAILGFDGMLMAGAALTLAPQCIGNPLSSLDPLLVTLWLNNVSEAQSIFSELRNDPGIVGGFYAPGLFAIAICGFRIWQRDRVELHALLLPLLLVSALIAFVQVRGSIFLNLVAIVPSALLVSELRQISNRDSENVSKGFAFVTATLFSVPSFWALGGTMLTEGTAGLTNRMENVISSGTDTSPTSCTSRRSMQQLLSLKPGLVAAPSNSGVDILRFTENRVLSAPYHRNQGGMLTELHIGLAQPDEADAFLRGADVATIAFCPDDVQTEMIIAMKPDGLYAALSRGEVPAYLKALPKDPESGFQIYQVELPDLK